MRSIHLVFLALVIAGCGGSRYLHLRDGIALECRHVERADDLDGYLVELSASGATLLVDDERVRTQDPITGTPEGDRVIDDTDPGDASTGLSNTATLLIAALGDSLGLDSDTELAFLRTENATPRRLSPTVVHESAVVSLAGQVGVVDGARRASIIESIDLDASDTEMSTRAVELAKFYGADFVIVSRVAGLRKTDPGESGYRYTLTLRAFDTTTGRERWHGSGSWMVDW